MSTASRLAKLAEGLDSNGVLSADKGGTGATSLAAVVTSATPAGVSDQANTSTGYFDLPSGTTAQRPVSATTGMVRYNSTLGIVETYNGTAWTGLGGSATVSTTAPQNPTEGSFWLKDDTGDLNVYAGGAWVLIAGGSGGDSLPAQTSNSGKFLTTDGTTASWGTVSVTPTAISDQDNASTGYFDIPTGTTAQRPVSATTGNLRFNSETNYLEMYTSSWGNVWTPFTPITATGGTVTQVAIDGVTYKVHTFSATASASFIVSNAGSPGNTFEVIMWGAGGGGGGNTASGASGGGGAYAKSTLTPVQATYTVSVGGGGSGAADGCVTTGGGAGGISSFGATGGKGTDPGSSPCSSPGGGGGAGSIFAQGTTVLVAAGGGGGGGGSESAAGGTVGFGGGGGQAGYNGVSGVLGGATGNQVSYAGAAGPQPSGDRSAGGGGGGGYRGGDYGQPPSADAVMGAGGGGGSSLADTIMNGVANVTGNSADPLRGTAGNGGTACVAGQNGIVIVRYPITAP